jgi:head-tail adaptor
VVRRELELQHVSDSENVADFLTKWVSKAKLHASVRYVTNQAAWECSGSSSAAETEQAAAAGGAQAADVQAAERLIAVEDAVFEAHRAASRELNQWPELRAIAKAPQASRQARAPRRAACG